jgi:hypothetical protein
MDDEGKPITSATVIATIDQDVGQPIHIDSNGVLQAELPIAAKSLRLTANASGNA